MIIRFLFLLFDLDRSKMMQSETVDIYSSDEVMRSIYAKWCALNTETSFDNNSLVFACYMFEIIDRRNHSLLTYGRIEHFQLSKTMLTRIFKNYCWRNNSKRRYVSRKKDIEKTQWEINLPKIKQKGASSLHDHHNTPIYFFRCIYIKEKSVLSMYRPSVINETQPDYIKSKPYSQLTWIWYISNLYQRD
jgi:hypothetical protein